MFKGSRIHIDRPAARRSRPVNLVSNDPVQMRSRLTTQLAVEVDRHQATQTLQRSKGLRLLTSMRWWKEMVVSRSAEFGSHLCKQRLERPAYGTPKSSVEAHDPM